GGGGLIGGTALALKERRRDIRVVGVEPEGADAVRRSWLAGRPVTLERPHSVADKLVAKSTDQLNVDLVRKYVDEIVTVTDAALEAATYDYLERLARLVPDAGDYRHAEGNGPAHIKSVLVGHDVTVAVKTGELALGRWQGIYLAEFDGPRTRSVTVTVVGDGSG